VRVKSIRDDATRKRFLIVWGFVHEVLWPRRLDGTVGRLLGALSLLALVRLAFDFGLSATVAQVFRLYDGVLGVLLGWLDPYLQTLLTSVLANLHLRIKLDDYWHHVFVVLQILFGRDAGVAYSSGRRRVAVVRFVVGFCIASIVAVLSGIQIPGNSDFVSNFIFAVLPTVGIYVYDLAMYCHAAMYQLTYLNRVDGLPDRTRANFFKGAVKRGTVRLAIGLGITLACFLIPLIRDAPVPAGGLIALGVATVGNASYWLWRGSKDASKEARLGRDWLTSFRKSEAGRFGVAISGVLVWTAILAGLNLQLAHIGL